MEDADVEPTRDARIELPVDGSADKVEGKSWRTWPRDHKFAFGSLVVGVIAAVIAALTLVKDGPAPNNFDSNNTHSNNTHSNNINSNNTTIQLPPASTSGVISSAPLPTACVHQESDMGSLCIEVKSLGNAEQWSHETSTTLGDYVGVSLTYVFMGVGQRDNVVLQAHSSEPSVLELMPGTTTAYLSPDGDKLTDGLFEPGINMGSYAHGGGVSLVSMLRLNRPPGFVCGSYAVTLRAEAWNLQYTAVQDSAEVRVVRECKK
jgi:hypothetical protein